MTRVGWQIMAYRDAAMARALLTFYAGDNVTVEGHGRFVVCVVEDNPRRVSYTLHETMQAAEVAAGRVRA